MTNRERIIKAVKHQEADIIPYTVDLGPEMWEKLKNYYNNENFAQKLMSPLSYTGAGGFPVGGWLGDDIVQDHFGVRWDKSRDKGVGVVIENLVNEDNVDDFPFPDSSDPNLYAHMSQRNPDQFVIAAVPLAYFERAWSLCGMENLLAGMAGDERFVFRLLERILDFNMTMIRHYVEYDIDCVHINDDYGQQTNLIMGPKHWRKFFKPGLKEMAGAVKSKGKYVYLHSCGNISEIIPDLIEIGVDIINPFQPEVMDVFHLKNEYGKDMTFHGGISEQMTLNFGTPDDVEREMRDKMARLGKGGGYILAPSQGMTANVPAENAARFIEVASSQ